MRINYFSDIHLEFGDLESPDNDADLVIAAGDIGVYDQGIKWLKRLDKPVIYVAGNHEFYGNEYHDTMRLLKQECAGTNISFLENDSIVMGDVRFIGCTLWADLFLEGEDKADALGQTLNDFKRIKFEEQQYNQKVFSEFYAHSNKWLISQLAKPFDGKTIVVTHHAPTEWSWNDSPNALKKLAYCNDLKYLFHEYEIAAWFHGHVHSMGDYRIAGSRILSNPRGYVGRRLVDQFEVNRIVEL